jgi:hypothetical protein
MPLLKMALGLLIGYRIAYIYRWRPGDCASGPQPAAMSQVYPKRLLVMTYNIEGDAELLKGSKHIDDIAAVINQVKPGETTKCEAPFLHNKCALPSVFPDDSRTQATSTCTFACVHNADAGKSTVIARERSRAIASCFPFPAASNTIRFEVRIVAIPIVIACDGT